MEEALRVRRRTVHNGRTRSVYVTGEKKGELRVSRAARKRMKESVEERRVDEEGIQGVGELIGELQLDGNVDRVSIPTEKRSFRLGKGWREGKTDQTRYEVDNEWSLEGVRIEVEGDDVLSGRRWFKERFPDEWMNELSLKERESKAGRMQRDYGKEFVEHEGRWYEVMK